MAKVAVPILKLMFNQRDAYPNEIHSIFVSEKAWDDSDEVTFTGGVHLPRESVDWERRRDRIKVKLEALFKKHYGNSKFIAPLKMLLELLEANDWSVSFYVDCL